MNGSASPRIPSRADVEAALLREAEAFPAFRALLLANPREALKGVLGADPLPNHALRVIEEAPGEVLLVLPRALQIDELPDALLDIVSGSRPRADDGSVRSLCPEDWYKANPLPR